MSNMIHTSPANTRRVSKKRAAPSHRTSQRKRVRITYRGSGNDPIVIHGSDSDDIPLMEPEDNTQAENTHEWLSKITLTVTPDHTHRVRPGSPVEPNGAVDINLPLTSYSTTPDNEHTWPTDFDIPDAQPTIDMDKWQQLIDHVNAYARICDPPAPIPVPAQPLTNQLENFDALCAAIESNMEPPPHSTDFDPETISTALIKQVEQDVATETLAIKTHVPK